MASGLRQRVGVLFGAAVLLAGGTAGGAFWVISGYQQQLVSARHGQDAVTLLVATRDLGVGAVLDASAVTSVAVPSTATVDGATFSDPAELDGQLVVSPIYAGEQLRRERVAPSLPIDVLSATVGPGLRAMTVEVTRAAGVGGHLVRGDHVDVIVTIRPEENALDAKWVTQTILQGIKVLDTGQPDAVVDPKDPKPARAAQAAVARATWITLELAPDDAEKLAMASARGEIHVALRGQADAAVVAGEEPLVTNAMVGLAARPAPERAHRAAAPAPAEPAPEPMVARSAQIIQGADSKEQEIGNDAGRSTTRKQ